MRQLTTCNALRVGLIVPALLLLSTVGGHAQPGQARPAFEVASVKPGTKAGPGESAGPSARDRSRRTADARLATNGSGLPLAQRSRKICEPISTLAIRCAQRISERLRAFE
jgi:hypothetical protein